MRRAVLLILAALGTGLLGFVVAVRLALSGGPEVRVVNRTGGTVTDVELRYTGGAEKLESLAGGASWTRPLDPSGESALDVSWLETVPGAGQVRRSERINVYLSPGLRGRYELELHEGGEVAFRGESELSREGAP